MITVRQYNKETDFSLWNEFVSKAKNSLFMHDRNFMDYHSDRFIDNSLIFFDEDEVIALLPANKKNNELFSHGGLTYGGFITDSKMKQYKMLECFELLKNYMTENNFSALTYKTIPYCYFTNPSQEDLYALFKNNAYILKIEPSSCIDFRFPIKLPKGRKAQISRAKREGVLVNLSTDFNTFINLENSVLQEHHNTKAVHTAKELELLHSRFPDKIELYSANYKDEMIAGVLLFIYNNVVHTQYMAANHTAREIGALDYCVSEIMNKYSQTKQFLDFGISSEDNGKLFNEGLASQKEGFGARTISYQTWKLEV